jgi:heptosyltransferase-2
MKVAVLKPDHLGDLVLAAPALAALQRQFADVTLLCHPDSAALARHLFPGLALRPVLLPHLDRTRHLDLGARPLAALGGRFDLLICLRWDEYLKAQLDDPGLSYHAAATDCLDVHVTVEQREVIAPWTGPYDLLTSYRYTSQPPLTRKRPGSVGLCIAAGHSLNAWPLNHWLELAQRLQRRGLSIVLIGGPAETTRLRVLAEAMAISKNRSPRVLLGDSDFARFLRDLAESVDLVIASDSGTAHLASLVRPVLSLFGGSPWRRFAPLGPDNAVISRQLPCSPCPQFDRTLLNTCQSRECLVNLSPEQVEACLDSYRAGKASVRPQLVHGAWLARSPWETCSSHSIQRTGAGHLATA